MHNEPIVLTTRPCAPTKIFTGKNIVPDGRVVRAGISVTHNVLSRSLKRRLFKLLGTIMIWRSWVRAPGRVKLGVHRTSVFDTLVVYESKTCMSLPSQFTLWSCYLGPLKHTKLCEILHHSGKCVLWKLSGHSSVPRVFNYMYQVLSITKDSDNTSHTSCSHIHARNMSTSHVKCL